MKDLTDRDREVWEQAFQLGWRSGARSMRLPNRLRRGWRRVLAFVLPFGVVALAACVPAPQPSPQPPCDEAALAEEAFEAFPEPEGVFLVTACVDGWASGAVYPVVYDAFPPVEVLFKAQDGEWVAVDRGFGMCARQGVPADVARQLGCVV